jgi:hypothetical protein
LQKEKIPVLQRAKGNRKNQGKIEKWNKTQRKKKNKTENYKKEGNEKEIENNKEEKFRNFFKEKEDCFKLVPSILSNQLVCSCATFEQLRGRREYPGEILLKHSMGQMLLL